MFNIRYGFNKQLPRGAMLYLASEQVHGSEVSVFNSNSIAGSYETPGVDGVIYWIREPVSVCVSVQTADCLPILLFDRQTGLMGAVHMGYKSAYLGILDNLIKILLGLKVDLRNLTVRFGPSINGACYNIPMPRYRNFLKSFSRSDRFLFQAEKNNFLSLALFAYYQFRDAGVPKHRLFWQIACTHCQRRQYYSYRRGDRNHNQFSYLIYEP